MTNNSKVAFIAVEDEALGRGLLIDLLDEGYRVFFLVGSVAQELEIFNLNPASVIPIRTDIGENSSERIITEMLALHTARVDFLVCGSVIAGATAPLGELSIEELGRALDFQLFGYFRCLRACLSFLRASGSATLVHLLPGSGGSVGRSAAGAAAAALTRSASAELAGSNVRIFSIDPAMLNDLAGNEASISSAIVRFASERASGVPL